MNFSYKNNSLSSVKTKKAEEFVKKMKKIDKNIILVDLAIIVGKNAKSTSVFGS